MKHNSKGLRTALALSGAAAATALALAGCSSSGGGATAAAAPARQMHSSSTPQVRIETQSGSLGAHLTDGSGRSLYMFGSDRSSKSTCDGACATYWPPLAAKNGAVSVAGAAKRADLGTVRRADGSMQETYAGHPLYFYVGDTKAGQTNGQGLTDFGARWSLVTPAGTPVGTGGSSSTSGYGAGGPAW